MNNLKFIFIAFIAIFATGCQTLGTDLSTDLSTPEQDAAYHDMRANEAAQQAIRDLELNQNMFY